MPCNNINSNSNNNNNSTSLKWWHQSIHLNEEPTQVVDVVVTLKGKVLCKRFFRISRCHCHLIIGFVLNQILFLYSLLMISLLKIFFPLRNLSPTFQLNKCLTVYLLWKPKWPSKWEKMKLLIAILCLLLTCSFPLNILEQRNKNQNQMNLFWRKKDKTSFWKEELSISPTPNGKMC